MLRCCFRYVPGVTPADGRRGAGVGTRALVAADGESFPPTSPQMQQQPLQAGAKRGALPTFGHFLNKKIRFSASAGRPQLRDDIVPFFFFSHKRDFSLVAVKSR